MVSKLIIGQRKRCGKKSKMFKIGNGKFEFEKEPPLEVDLDIPILHFIAIKMFAINFRDNASTGVCDKIVHVKV